MQPAWFLYAFLIAVSTPPLTTTMREEWPSNIWVQSELRGTVRELWRTSPTFREQCEKIGADRHYHVHIVLDASLVIHRRCRAQCTIRSYATGLVIARVAVPDRHELHELIPHELEHVVEHLEGVDVKGLLRSGRNGVFEAGDGRIETARAIDAGRRVQKEMVTNPLVSRR